MSKLFGGKEVEIMTKKYEDLFDLPLEQVAHDLSIARLQILKREKFYTTGEFVNEYIDGVEIIKKTIEAILDPTVK